MAFCINDINADESPMQFPCDFTVKAMGIKDDSFEALVVSIVRKHVPKLGEGAVKTRPSSKGKYIAVSVSFIAESRDQMDDLYRELSGHEKVLYAI